MKKKFATVVAFLHLLSLNIYALNRDYKSECDEEQLYQQYYSSYCPEHVPGEIPEWMDAFEINLLPTSKIKCSQCNENSVYVGYFDVDFQKYHSHLKEQIEHFHKHRNCSCYWPELSKEAAKISDYAYILFKDLISTTALSRLLRNETEQKAFLCNPGWFFNLHGMTIAFIAHQFRFSDYYHVCKDIENYSTVHFGAREAAKIKDKLANVIEALYSKFLKFHSKCYKEHPSACIKQEILLMKLLAGDLSGLDEKMSITGTFTHLIDEKLKLVGSIELANEDFPVIDLEFKGFQTSISSSFLEIESSVKTNVIPFSAHSEVLLEQGAILNDLLLYKGAVEVLTKALKYNPSNRNVYIERARAYFETNQINLALKDYKKATELISVPLMKLDKMMIDVPSKIDRHRMMIYVPEQKAEFVKGLVTGIIDGARISGEEFIPSIFDCCRGILCGLWAFAASPSEVSLEMINATYAIGEFLAYHSTKECLECVVPELRELSIEWEKINDRIRGKKIGYIIGKYGLEVFAPVVALKGISKLRAMKRANTMSTLEVCAISQAKKKKILEESAKRSALRKAVISDAIDNGKILVKNYNSKIHIMQPKHKWHKVIELTGNIEIDCKNAIKLLEENQIFLKKYKIKEIESKGYVLYRQEMEINNLSVVAEFSKNMETGEMFLNNAWVGH